MTPQLAHLSTVSDQSLETRVPLAITEQVAAKKGVDPLDLPPLHTAIDPDALAALVNHRDAAAELDVQFSYAGYLVSVTGDGAVSVRE